jgi:mono/diheme cytochrome c family protein/uncharacterized membrane protein
MRSCRAAIHLWVLAGLWLLLSRGAGHLLTPAAVHAQTDPGRELFRQHCVKCHGADGTGSPARGRLPVIPDFTAAAWQARQSETQLLASILDGKGEEMPSFRGKLSEAQARALVAQVRAFAAAAGKPKPAKQQEPAAPAGSEKQLRRLQDEMDELKRQFREGAERAADKKAPDASAPPAPPPPSKPAESSPRTTPATPSAPAPAGAPAGREVFRQHCIRCHGADGTGSRVRHRQPAIPNFTDPAWQARRSEAQLLASILDGRGEEMPPWREKLDEKQARGLVAYVRAFARNTGAPDAASQPANSRRDRPIAEEPEEPTEASPAEVEPSGGFLGKLIPWLGRFHPAAVHFPLALLTAAAVAELLRLLTGKPAFDAVSRYCVWFGALTAVVAGLLGWCLGEFRLTDASGVLMTHRWLGTCTVASAGLVLVLGEASRRPDRRRTRLAFRVTLLVVAVLVLVTGFFGGAVVYGLDHYTWPR